jgi:phosphoribosyl 1,2-cyclic phosphate phosphodiesterase
VRKDYDYAFASAEERYRGVPEIRLHEIDPSQPFVVDGVEIVPIVGSHSRFAVTGYRIGPLAYMTDFKELLDGEEEKLQGIDTLVVNALRFREHHSHFNVEEALALINRIKPRVAYLTHMSHEIGLHAETAEKLPEGVFLGYDGLSIEIKE